MLRDATHSQLSSHFDRWIGPLCGVWPDGHDDWCTLLATAQDRLQPVLQPCEADPYRRVAHLLARASASIGDSKNADSALEASRCRRDDRRPGPYPGRPGVTHRAPFGRRGCCQRTGYVGWRLEGAMRGVEENGQGMERSRRR